MLVGIQRRTRVRGEGGHAGALADNLQLLHRTRALQVAGHQHRGVALLGQVVGQLAGQRGLTGTLQTGEHDHGRRVFRHVEPARLAAEDVGQLLVDDLDHLLRRVQRRGHVCA